ncbi:hypothetical protein LUW76_19480 [Actinomadura madurae]|uniref:hypothetical protein n=1 Tax=Actinomadura madurae TaxID=1993 RepID=UPI002026B414|nr:hypothetical protein [Actinomadura madurae]MCQ0008435.1 hypothetical protein [Actinomadura madurae]MCQ0016248.1 hypothetical protein [Actinomadura madurae]URM96335.1 hypothetical protein LUW76_19480 [Actinomadura madurae]
MSPSLPPPTAPPNAPDVAPLAMASQVSGSPWTAAVATVPATPLTASAAPSRTMPRTMPLIALSAGPFRPGILPKPCPMPPEMAPPIAPSRRAEPVFFQSTPSRFPCAICTPWTSRSSPPPSRAPNAAPRRMAPRSRWLSHSSSRWKIVLDATWAPASTAGMAAVDAPNVANAAAIRYAISIAVTISRAMNMYFAYSMSSAPPSSISASCPHDSASFVRICGSVETH